MAEHTYTISSAQSRLPRLVREAEEGRPIPIRRRNDTVAYIVSRERLEAIVETMEILANPEARKAIDQHRAGKARFAPLSALDER